MRRRRNQRAGNSEFENPGNRCFALPIEVGSMVPIDLGRYAQSEPTKAADIIVRREFARLAAGFRNSIIQTLSSGLRPLNVNSFVRNSRRSKPCKGNTK